MQYGVGTRVYERVDGWADLPDGESFRDVGGLCVDRGDAVVALNRSEHPVMRFDATGARLAAWDGGVSWTRPHGLALDSDGNVYCTDDGNHTVRKFAPGGELLLTLGTEDEPSETGYRQVSDPFERLASIARGAGPFNRPTGVTVLETGDVFVADGYGNARVHVFGPGGRLRRSWGEPGAAPGAFRVPHSIHHDGDRRVWVTDRENSRIQIFDADGAFVAEWTDLIRPTDLAISDGLVFVTELCKRLSVFTTEGELLTRWDNRRRPADSPLFVAPHAVAVDSSGDLYVGEAASTYENTDLGARAVQKFERVE